MISFLHIQLIRIQKWIVLSYFAWTHPKKSSTHQEIPAYSPLIDKKTEKAVWGGSILETRWKKTLPLVSGQRTETRYTIVRPISWGRIFWPFLSIFWTRTQLQKSSADRTNLPLSYQIQGKHFWRTYHKTRYVSPILFTSLLLPRDMFSPLTPKDWMPVLENGMLRMDILIHRIHRIERNWFFRYHIENPPWKLEAWTRASYVSPEGRISPTFQKPFFNVYSDRKFGSEAFEWEASIPTLDLHFEVRVFQDQFHFQLGKIEKKFQASEKSRYNLKLPGWSLSPEAIRMTEIKEKETAYFFQTGKQTWGPT